MKTTSSPQWSVAVDPAAAPADVARLDDALAGLLLALETPPAKRRRRPPPDIHGRPPAQDKPQKESAKS
jgi:hypothetical protein